VWVALRTDGQAGSGTVTDPFDGTGVEKLNALFDTFRDQYGDNLTIHFGPGVFYGDRIWGVRDNWKIRGAGMDVTVFKTRDDPEATGTVGFREGGYLGGPSGVEVSDLTFDFNAPNLRKANRAFLWPRGSRPRASYVYAASLPDWDAEKEYRRGAAVVYEGAEYIALQTGRGNRPGQNEYWSRLRPNRAAELPAWEAGKAYAPGDAVALGDAAYLCKADSTGQEPAGAPDQWERLDPDAPDPLIYTHAVFVHARPPGGRNRVSRVCAINGNGSAFFSREAFIIGLGGNDCVIEDCVVEQFHGDYSSLIVMTFGQHGVVRGCTVRGNDGLTTMAYGGWACWDTVFEGNFCTNVRAATNIDSLNCRNVTFRGNVFMNCREVGILVNVGGRDVADHERYSMEIDGATVPIVRSCMDGLFICDNLVQMRDDAPYGAIQAQVDGLSNVRIRDNVLRTMSGAGPARAIGVLGKCPNVTVCGNTCEPGMYSEIPDHVVCYDNFDLAGNPMRNRLTKPLADRAVGGQ